MVIFLGILLMEVTKEIYQEFGLIAVGTDKKENIYGIHAITELLYIDNYLTYVYYPTS